MGIHIQIGTTLHNSGYTRDTAGHSHPNWYNITQLWIHKGYCQAFTSKLVHYTTLDTQGILPGIHIQIGTTLHNSGYTRDTGGHSHPNWYNITQLWIHKGYWRAFTSKLVQHYTTLDTQGILPGIHIQIGTTLHNSGYTRDTGGHSHPNWYNITQLWIHKGYWRAFTSKLVQHYTTTLDTQGILPGIHIQIGTTLHNSGYTRDTARHSHPNWYNITQLWIHKGYCQAFTSKLVQHYTTLDTQGILPGIHIQIGTTLHNSGYTRDTARHSHPNWYNITQLWIHKGYCQAFTLSLQLLDHGPEEIIINVFTINLINYTIYFHKKV